MLFHHTSRLTKSRDLNCSSVKLSISNESETAFNNKPQDFIAFCYCNRLYPMLLPCLLMKPVPMSGSKNPFLGRSTEWNRNLQTSCPKTIQNPTFWHKPKRHLHIAAARRHVATALTWPRQWSWWFQTPKKCCGAKCHLFGCCHCGKNKRSSSPSKKKTGSMGANKSHLGWMCPFYREKDRSKWRVTPNPELLGHDSWHRLAWNSSGWHVLVQKKAKLCRQKSVRCFRSRVFGELNCINCYIYNLYRYNLYR